MTGIEGMIDQYHYDEDLREKIQRLMKSKNNGTYVERNIDKVFQFKNIDKERANRIFGKLKTKIVSAQSKKLTNELKTRQNA